MFTNHALEHQHVWSDCYKRGENYPQECKGKKDNSSKIHIPKPITGLLCVVNSKLL